MPKPELTKKQLNALFEEGLDQAQDAIDQGDFDAAEELCQDVLEAQPKHARAKALLGVVAVHSGDTEAGAQLLSEAIGADPAQATVAFELGAELCRQGFLDVGAKLLQVGLAGKPNTLSAWLDLGRAQSGMDDHLAAIQSYSQALKRDDGNTDALLNIGSSLGELGRAAEAETVFRKLLSKSPDFPPAVANLASALAAQGRFDEAATALRRVLQLAPELARAHADLARCLLESPDTTASNNSDAKAEAIRLLEKSVTLDPQHAQLQFEFGTALLSLGEPERALQLARSFLELFPDDSGLRAVECSALSRLNRTLELAPLRDYETLVSASKVTVPSGFSDQSAFDTALTKHVLQHPTLIWSPLSYQTRNARHSGSLLTAPLGPIDALKQLIEESVNRYCTELKKRQHPLGLRQPEERFLNIWGVVMGQTGHQVPHVHPSAWLSGVYYPAVPQAINDTGHGGWLEFCADADADVTEPGLYSVKPESGLLVLFPSYLYHYTRPMSAGPLDAQSGAPTESAEDPDSAWRVSVAFDLLAIPD